MTKPTKQTPVPVDPRLATCIAKEAQAIDYQLLFDGTNELIQANLQAEALAQRKLGRETANLLGPHIRTFPKQSAWEAYRK